MGSYGVGVSRLIAAIIEANNDENGIVWPKEVSPFDVHLVNLKPENEQCSEVCNDLYQKLKESKDTLYDDTIANIGVKLSNADLIGIPIQIIIGPKSIKENCAEVRYRRSSERSSIKLDQVIQFIS